MLRAIVAIDSERGLADERGIPWQGKIPGDAAYFKAQTLQTDIVMGSTTYQEFTLPLPDRQNYVLTHGEAALRPGFMPLHDLSSFLATHRNAWVIGGAGLFGQTIDLLDELYITQLCGAFGCTKFFPEFRGQFDLVSDSEPQTENGITYSFQIWRRTVS